MSTDQHGKKPGWSFFPVHTLPASLDIVWCRFPEIEYPTKPGPKPRPALVRSLFLNKAQTAAGVEVTYGTSKIGASADTYDLIVSNMVSIEASGLPCATRFAIDRTIRLPWCSEFFEPREGYNSPLIGSLDTPSRMQLEALKVMRRQPRRR